MHRCLPFLFSLLLVTACGRKAPPADAPLLNLPFLLTCLTDVERFALPPLGESFLESTYDRSGGNRDWAVYTNVPPSGRVVVLDVEGPGYVSRIWTASPIAHRWFFFFDGETEARLVLDQDALFGGQAPFLPPLAGESGGGRYCLLPLPYARSLRVEIEPRDRSPGGRNYLQINHTRLPDGAYQVHSYPVNLAAVDLTALDQARERLSTCREALAAEADALLAPAPEQVLAPGHGLPVWEDDGPGLLQAFALRIESPGPAEVMRRELLRSLRLRMTWDGLPDASVDVPLGDFFGNPLHLRSFASLPLGRVHDAYVCRFPMPYQHGARVELINTGTQAVTLRSGARGDRTSAGNHTRRFHAAWRASNQSGRPLRMVYTEGSGHYVGCFLSAVGQDGSWNMLEGDEALRPDRGRQPPQLGTGLEDYFNGAYYYTSLFDLPFHALLEKGAMRTDQLRLHLLDAISFQERFEASLEFGDQNAAQGTLASLCFWYADQAAAVPLLKAQEPLLARPPDRFELPGLMAPFFLLERAGLYQDAMHRAGFLALRHSKQAWSDLLRVRALDYRLRLQGLEAVRGELEGLSRSPYPAAAQAAADLLWLAAAPGRGLLGIHAMADYELALDGAVLARGTGNGELRVQRMELPDTPGQWTLALKPTRQGSFFSFCLRTAEGEITSAGEWEIEEVAPLPGRPPPTQISGRSMLPNMTVWAFEPNAFAGMQSAASGINLWSFWDRSPLVNRLELRKTWPRDPPADSGHELGDTRSEAERQAHATYGAAKRPNFQK